MQRVDFEGNIMWRTSLKSGGIVSLALQPASGSVALCPGAALLLWTADARCELHTTRNVAVSTGLESSAAS